MSKSSEIAEHIKKLREGRWPSQVKFAEVLGVTPPTVSRWEAGEVTPPAEACLQLGNLAPYPENLWFWQQAGIDSEAMVSVAGQILKERGAQPATGETVRVPSTPASQQEGEEAGPLIVLPAKFVSNPLSTRGLVIDDKLANPIFPAGDVVVLDESANNAEDLRPLWGQVVLVHLTRPKHTTGLRMTEFWKEELNIGRLLYKEYVHDPLSWVATLGPFDDAETRYHPGDTATVVGSWQHPRPPKDPIAGSPRERASQELQKVYAQYLRVRDRARSGTVYYTTPEVEQAEKALHEAQDSVLQQDHAEMREAQEEAKLQAPMKMRLTPGCRVLGCVIGWLRTPDERRGEKEKEK